MAAPVVAMGASIPAEPPAPRRRAKRRPGRFLAWALIVTVVCVGGVAGVSMAYAGASVTAKPRTEEITASTTLMAQISAPVGTLAFTRVTAAGLSGEEAVMAAFEENSRDAARVGGG